MKPKIEKFGVCEKKKKKEGKGKEKEMRSNRKEPVSEE